MRQGIGDSKFPDVPKRTGTISDTMHRHSSDGSTRPVLDVSLTGLTLGDAQVLGSIALTVSRGETLALVGPSGIGKSSLLRIFAGLETGHTGTCTITGQSAIVFQEPALLPWRNLRDNLTVTTGITPAAAMAALHDVGLETRADDFPGQLSLGQQRRLSLARAFATKPDLLLLDEPFVSLDPGLVLEMMEIFRTLSAAHNVATVLVTHVQDEARALADRIITLGGQPAQITGEERLF